MIMASNIEIVNQLIVELEDPTNLQIDVLGNRTPNYLKAQALRKLVDSFHTVERNCEKWRIKHSKLLENYKELEALMAPSSPDLGDLSELPDELFEELSIAKPDELTKRLLLAVNSYGNMATLDQILVALYRKFGEVYERRTIQNKLYRAPGIYQVPGEKGMFSTTKFEESGC